MIGVIERIKNSVLLKCSTLNDHIISDNLIKIIDRNIYHFAEDIESLITDNSININEETLRDEVSKCIKNPIIKKIKRKLFIDSLALQITNDTYIEDCLLKKESIDKINKQYLKELSKNKSSNQLNMTEDLDLTSIISILDSYISDNIISKVNENVFLVSAIDRALKNLKDELEKNLKEMIDQTDKKYMDILIEELTPEVTEEEIKEEYEEESDTMNIEENILTNESVVKQEANRFDKYDDMTLFNKTILSLNTKEEKLARREAKIETRRKEIEEKLAITNKNIEANIERENKLSQIKIELNERELELNSKLSEAEVIFLNMKPLIKGLNNIKTFDSNGGSTNE